MGRNRDDDDWGFLAQVAAIALGVFIGGLGAMLAWEAITAWRLEQASKEAVKVMKQSMEKIQQGADKLQIEQRQRAVLLEQVRQNSLNEEAAKKAAIAAAEQERREKAARKEAAWQKFYQPSDACRHDSADISCANRFMASRKAFEQQYRD